MKKSDQLIQLAAERHLIRTRDLKPAGIQRTYLAQLVRRGKLQKLGRGLYATRLPMSENFSLLEVSLRVPKAVICLLSALRFHEIGSQSPHEVWIALKGRTPRIRTPRIRVVRFSEETLRYGVEDHEVEGGRIRIFSVTKTVADCFKFRNKIGLEVALEALRDAHRQKKATIDDLMAAAKVCRVANVMRPYLESLR